MVHKIFVQKFAFMNSKCIYLHNQYIKYIQSMLQMLIITNTKNAQK